MAKKEVETPIQEVTRQVNKQKQIYTFDERVRNEMAMASNGLLHLI